MEFDAVLKGQWPSKGMVTVKMLGGSQLPSAASFTLLRVPTVRRCSTGTLELQTVCFRT